MGYGTIQRALRKINKNGQGENAPPRCHRLPKKKPRARFGVPLYMMLVRGVSCSLHGHGTWRSQTGTDLEASILLASSHGAGRCSPNCWGRNVIDSLIQLWTLWATIMPLTASFQHNSASLPILTDAQIVHQNPKFSQRAFQLLKPVT